MSLPTNGTLNGRLRPEERLHYVNLALRILQASCASHGALNISSSTRMLEQRLSHLTTDQVQDINTTLYKLGLRTTKPGGSDHFIRMDIRRVTLEQLSAGQRIPHTSIEDETTEELVDLVQLALSGLREKATLIDHPSLTIGWLRGHYEIIESFAGALAGEVILCLKALDLYRSVPVGDGFVCFVNTTEPPVITLRMATERQPLTEWPSNLIELLPASTQVQSMTATEIIQRLVAICQQHEKKHATSEEEMRHLKSELATAREKIAALTEKLAELQARSAGSSMPAELRVAVEGVFFRSSN